MGYGVRGLGLGVWGHRYWDWGCGSGYEFHEERKGKDVGDTLKIEVPHIEFHTLSSYRARFTCCHSSLMGYECFQLVTNKGWQKGCENQRLKPNQRARARDGINWVLA
jgi:hypothetical protein